MTIEDCYRKIGGNYADVRARLLNDDLISKFIAKFPGDDTFSNLCAGIRDGNRAEAFRAAHTLKGICQNLGFEPLLASTGKLTELLRPEASGIPDEAGKLLDEIRRDYENTVSAILEYMEEHNN